MKPIQKAAFFLKAAFFHLVTTLLTSILHL